MDMLKIDPVENPDWDYARNKQVVIRSPLAEFSASAFSAPTRIGERTFCGANRDYSWQGLLAGPIEAAVYKILDAIYFSVPRTSPHSRHVLLGSDRCTYTYDCGERDVSFTLTLRSLAHGILLEASVTEPCWFAVMLDSRRAESWDESTYDIDLRGDVFLIRPSATSLQMIIQGFATIEPVNLQLNWTYKLGDGFRRIESGVVKFVKHQRTIHVPTVFFCPSGLLRIRIPVPFKIPTEERHSADFEKLSVGGDGLIAEAISFRLKTLSSYSMLIDGRWFPQAGSWWFRKAWTRDALEGLRWNIKTYLQIFNWNSKVNSLVRYLLDTVRCLGGLPITIGSEEFASDAPPQLLNVSCRAAEISNSHELLLESVNAAEFIAKRLLSGAEVSRTVLRDSILCSPANSSWIDSVVNSEGKRWPARLPTNWAKHGISPFSNDYGLVEVNALYIEALRRLAATGEHFGVRIPRIVEELLGVLRDGFLKYFRKEGMPPITVAPSYGLVDHTAGSPAVLSVSVLVGFLYERELAQIWRVISEKLLVYRRLVMLGQGWFPFGMLVRALEKVPYLGDLEYHGPTVWPRDTPYLLGIMENMGENVKGLLLNNLDHMLAEGAIGYCNELFSLPVGGNSTTCPESSNPVPVKNPAQYWSHWCDPYLHHLPSLLQAESTGHKPTGVA